MRKKLLFGSAFVLLLVLFVVVFFLSREDYVLLEGREDLDSGNSDLDSSEPVSLVSAWSTASGELNAVADTSRSIKEKIPKPAFIFLYFTDPYDPVKISEALKEEFKDTKIVGIQSSLGVFTEEGFHSSPNGAIALLAFDGMEMKLGIGGAALKEGMTHEELAQKSITEARKNSGMPLKTKPSGIFTGQFIGHSERYCSELNKLFPKDIPMIGGNQITNKVEPGAIIVNDKVYKNGFVIILFYTSRKTGAYFHSGFAGKEKSGIVTKLKSDNPYVIEEFDNKPALEIYNEWTDGALSKYLNAKKDVVVNETTLCPLAKGLLLKDGSIKYLNMHPWKFFPDGSVNVGVAVKKGERIYYVEGSRMILKKRSGFVARKAMENGKIKLNDMAGGIHVYCIGAGMTLGINDKAELDAMVKEISKNVNHQPFVGGFLGGEQGIVSGYGYFAANLMSSMIVFSKKEHTGE